jgi:hypothetical protein
VVTDMRGSSERDSAARAVAALQWLQSIAESQGAAERALDYDTTQSQLSTAEQEKYDANDPGFMRCYHHYRFSPEFVRILLDRYFTPAWQSRHLKQMRATVMVEAMGIPPGTVRASPFAAAAKAGCADDKAALAGQQAIVDRDRTVSQDEWPSAERVVRDMAGTAARDERAIIRAGSALYVLRDLATRLGASTRAAEYEEKRRDLSGCGPAPAAGKSKRRRPGCRSMSPEASRAFWTNVASAEFADGLIDRYFSAGWQSRHLNRSDFTAVLETTLGRVVFCAAASLGEQGCKKYLPEESCTVLVGLATQFARGKPFDWKLVDDLVRDIVVNRLIKDMPALQKAVDALRLMQCMTEDSKH